MLNIPHGCVRHRCCKIWQHLNFKKQIVHVNEKKERILLQLWFLLRWKAFSVGSQTSSKLTCKVERSFGKCSCSNGRHRQRALHHWHSPLTLWQEKGRDKRTEWQAERGEGEGQQGEKVWKAERGDNWREATLPFFPPFLLWGHFVSAAFTKLTPPPSFFSPFIISFSPSPFIWPLPHSSPPPTPPPCSHHAWLGPGHLLPLQQGCTISDQQGNCCSLHAAGFRCADALSVTPSLCVCCHARPRHNNWEILKDSSAFISAQIMSLQF